MPIKLNNRYDRYILEKCSMYSGVKKVSEHPLRIGAYIQFDIAKPIRTRLK